MKGKEMKQKIKLGIILGIEFVAIAVILILIFFAGKKSYKVTFDLNGGTLISGDLVQTVPQGKNATPPTVAKEGCYLRTWSASYKQVTRDIVVEAVWEWEMVTTVGFVYSSSENSDYCIIEDCFEDLYGDVYVPTHHGESKILGMADEVFMGCNGITYIHMLDGIISIGERAFKDCENLVAVELPGTLKKLGASAFENCTSLENVVISDELEVILPNTFAGCTSLEEIVIPASVKEIHASAFLGCTSLKKITFETEEITEVDEETEETVVIGKRGLEILHTGAFTGCDALTEIILPDTVKVIDELAFNNEELTVYLPFDEDNIPEGFAENFAGLSKLEWGYVAPEIEDNGKQKRGW